MTLNGAPQQGAEGEQRPAWFTAYLESLQVKREEVRAEALENVLQNCEDVSEVFKSNISAAYRTESQLEAARQADREALSQTLLRTPVVYTAPYVQFPWSLIGPEQGKICSRLNDALTLLDFLSKSLKSWLMHFDVIFSRKFVVEHVAKLSVVYNSCSLPHPQHGYRIQSRKRRFPVLRILANYLCAGELTKSSGTRPAATVCWYQTS